MKPERLLDFEWSSDKLAFWELSALPGPQSVKLPGGELRKGSRVRLRPRDGGDIFDLALAGRTARVEGIDQDLEGNLYIAVTVETDPGQDLGEARQPGHRFFFSIDEVEPLPPGPEGAPVTTRILVAGIGNIFLGDDGFGVEVARRLLEDPAMPGVEIVDFGIRGLDLAYALQNGYDALILVDAAPRGHSPGTVSVIEPVLPPAPELAGASATDRVAVGQTILEPHALDPVRVLLLARSLGVELPPVRLVACEPATLEPAGGGESMTTLSDPVLAAIGPAVVQVRALIAELRRDLAAHGPAGPWE